MLNVIIISKSLLATVSINSDQSPLPLTPYEVLTVLLVLKRARWAAPRPSAVVLQATTL